jgi:hypothetical protein
MFQYRQVSRHVHFSRAKSALLRLSPVQV